MEESTIKKRNGSIENKLQRAVAGTGLLIALFLFLLVFAEVVVTGYMIRDDVAIRTGATVQKTEDVLAELDQETAENYANVCADFISEHFEDVHKQVQSVVAYMALNPSPAQVRTKLSNLPEFNPDVPGALTMYVVPERGRVISTRSVAEDNAMDVAALHETRWYRRAVARNQPYHWSNKVKGVLSESEKVVCSAPYYDRYNRFAGVVVGAIEMSSIPAIVAQADHIDRIAMVLFDRKDRLMYATSSSEEADFAASLLGLDDFATEGDHSYALRKMTETGWTLCVVQDRTKQNGLTGSIRTDLRDYFGELQDDVRLRLLWGAGQCLALLLIGAWIMRMVAHRLAVGMARPIVRMTEQAEQIGGGDLSIKVDVETDDEIGRLGEAFNKMTEELRSRIEHIRTISSEKEHMSTERSLVRQIQWNMLPNVFPAFPERKDFDVYASLLPTDEGGGSFYDFFFIDAKTFCIAVGEASGTGILATMFAIVAKTNIKSYAQQGFAPDRILAETNNQLAYGNDEGITAHIFVGIINLSTGEAEYAYGGEAPVQWKHSGEAAAALPGKAGVTLGNMENVPYTKYRVRLSQGDLLFAHTKDTAECTDAHGNIYTAEYLYEKWGECAAKEYRLTQLVEALNEDIRDYTKDTERKEDVTMLMFRYWG